jgi:KDO2-lipid IV(A) lauroyltransferase
LEADRRITFGRLRRRALFLVMRWVLRRGGFDSARWWGAFLANVQYCCAGKTRRRCLEGVAAVLGRPRTDPQVTRTVRSGYRVNTIAVLEVLAMVDRKLDARRVRERCRVDGILNLEAARAGRGAILLATHSGNTLLLAAQLAEQGWPMTIVYRQSRMMSLPFFVNGLAHYGFDGVASNEGFRAYAHMLDALRHDRVVFVMMDQGVLLAETGVRVRFLGKDMPMPGGVVQLARQSRAPILPIAALAADPRWHFAIEPRLVLAPGGTIAEDTATVLKHVEGQILAHPELWSWQQRRWRNFPLPP